MAGKCSMDSKTSPLNFGFIIHSISNIMSKCTKIAKAMKGLGMICSLYYKLAALKSKICFEYFQFCRLVLLDIFLQGFPLRFLFYSGKCLYVFLRAWKAFGGINQALEKYKAVSIIKAYMNNTRLIYYYVTANKGWFWLFFGIGIEYFDFSG